MSIGDRLRYTPYLAAVVSAVVILLIGIGSADVVALLPSDAFDTLFGPTYFVVVLLTAFAAAPAAAKYLPMPGDERASTREAKPSFGFRRRSAALVVSGLAVALLLALALRLVGSAG